MIAAVVALIVQEKTFLGTRYTGAEHPLEQLADKASR
jgi:hypothetical protein